MLFIELNRIIKKINHDLLNPILIAIIKVGGVRDIELDPLLVLLKLWKYLLSNVLNTDF